MKLRNGTPEEAGMSPERIAHVARLAEGWVRDGIHPALVVLAARRGVIVLHEAVGKLTPEPDSPPLARDTIFPISSITKPITATCVMQLVEDGLLGLNRPVQDYIPEFVGEGKPAVMVHQLLTHTSGINEFELAAHMWRQHGNTGEPPIEAVVALGRRNDYLHRCYDAPLWKPPGVEMSYCNMNYALLGEIVQRVSGTALADLAAARIFAPLGMTNSYYLAPDAVEDRVVRRRPDAPYAALLENPEQRKMFRAFGSVSSTAIDMAVFLHMFLNGGTYGGVRILSPASVAEMTRNQIPGIGIEFVGERHAEASWGYGWAVQSNEKWMYYRGSLRSPRAFDHAGLGGVYLWVDPMYEMVGIYFSVGAEMLPSGRLKTCADLFESAVTAAVMDVEP
jgi:CubicO group peptidase (beta-lactamase class C family)